MGVKALFFGRSRGSVEKAPSIPPGAGKLEPTMAGGGGEGDSAGVGLANTAGAGTSTRPPERAATGGGAGGGAGAAAAGLAGSPAAMAPTAELSAVAASTATVGVHCVHPGQRHLEEPEGKPSGPSPPPGAGPSAAPSAAPGAAASACCLPALPPTPPGASDTAATRAPPRTDSDTVAGIDTATTRWTLESEPSPSPSPPSSTTITTTKPPANSHHRHQGLPSTLPQAPLSPISPSPHLLSSSPTSPSPVALSTSPAPANDSSLSTSEPASASEPTGSARRQERTPQFAVSMPSASQSGMQNRLSSSSSPSLPSAESTTPRASTTVAPAVAPPSDATANSNGASSLSSNPARPTLGQRSSSSSSASRPGLLSRISLPKPFRPRTRNVTDFHIRADEPHRQYLAGDHVRGSVILVVVKPIRVTHLTVALSGYVRVHKDPSIGAKVQTLTPGSLPQGTYDEPQFLGNGLASLFQDEQVLSGEGRIAVGKYQFDFDLVFPSKGLPSSIDFERGSISYMISATLTRPTSIAATSHCDRKVTLVNKVDIGRVRAPSPRTIFLEPVSKKARKKRSAALDKAVPATPEAANDLASESGSAGPSLATVDSGRERTSESRHPDQSDIRSEFSGESSRSVSTSGLSRAELAQVASAKQQVVDDKTITATVELLRGGCLPGETLTVKVSVQHIKRLKSMTGVIVTLYRQALIDSSPDPKYFSGESTKDDEKKGAYPKSRTGIAGLSISSADSRSVYRKDLDQNTAPLIVNPTTLQTSVTVSVKVPDDSFPSIKGVPGNMIGFNYRLEVIVDLGGKIANQFSGAKDARFGKGGSGSLNGNGSTYSPRRGEPVLANTAPLLREKGVIAVSMETVVGTTDSSRGRALPRISPSSRTLRTTLSEDDEAYLTEHSQPEDNHYGTPYANGHPSNGYFATQTNSRHYGQPPPHHPSGAAGPSQPYPYSVNGEEAPAYVPSPQLPDEQNLTEKDRIRQAETRLLPSQPDAGPSQPPDEDDIYDAENTPRLPHANPSSPQVGAGEGPSAPTEDDLARPGEPANGEDKQERERQRLMGEASAPPEVPEDMDRRQGGTAVRDMAPDAEPSAPSAPMLDEDDGYQGYGVGAGPSNAGTRDHNEQLPAYER